MKTGKRLRVGAVSYLNTKPLVYRLEEIAPDVELVFDLPSRLADSLSVGNLDVALIPSVEYLQDPTYSIVSDACIACRGPVLSVKLLSRVPVREIRSVALDEGSRTSVALLRILLSQQYDVLPEFEALPIGADPCDIQTDAVLLIGDRAIHPPIGSFVEDWDLGDAWCRWAKLPFVFAMWTARPNIDVGRLGLVLQEARDAGVSHLEEIAQCEAATVQLDPETCLEYLRDNLHFHLGERERQALQLFQQQAGKLADLVPSPALRSCASRNSSVKS